MNKSITDWLREGEALYESAVSEYRSLESQIQELEQKLQAKQTEVNQLAEIIGKEAIEARHRVTGQIIEPERNGHPSPGPVNTSSTAAIARVLTGRGLNK